MQQHTSSIVSSTYFFYSAISGGTIAIGDVTADAAGVASSGKVNIYELDQSSGTLMLVNEIFPHDPQTDSNFGSRVAMSGDLLLVGADAYDEPSNSNQGKVYVYVKSASNWVLDDELFAFVGLPDEFFGKEVAIDGDLAAISNEHKFGQHKVYVFKRDPQLGTWSNVAELDSGHSHFGSSIVVKGSEIIVRSYERVEIYEYDPLGGQVSHINSFSINPSLDSGRSIAYDGGSIAVGYATAGANYIGEVITYALDQTNNTWVEQQLIPNPALTPNNSDNFGTEISLKGNHLLVASAGSGVWHYKWDAGGAIWAQRGVAVAGKTVDIGSKGVVTTNVNPHEVHFFTP